MGNFIDESAVKQEKNGQQQWHHISFFPLSIN